MSNTLPVPDFSRLAPKAGSRMVVAGGCGGIGKHVVAACIANNLQVAVLDLASSLERNPVPAKATGFAIDATDESSVASGFERIKAAWGAIDHLIFLIGFALVPTRPLEQVSAAQWDDIMAGNLRSAFLVTRAALPLLREADGGSIVTVASGLAVSVLKGYGAYGSAKAGLIGLTKALAMENAPSIRANAVAPSAILTPFMGGGTGRGGEDRKSWDWFESKTDQYLPMIPLGRIAVEDDVVGPILFLASDAARYITGQTLHINGGRITP
ncbi:MAG: SDR family oxidoreductase [Betaproteobacteria bacterium]|nr:SDR family oxidoreductase [Betaproteobacteria bacterium]